MPDQPVSTCRRMDAVAITLLVIGLLLGLVLLSEPADNVSGLLGLFPSFLGAGFDRFRFDLIDALGVGVYLLLLGWLIIGVQRLFLTDWTQWSSRAIGWIVLVLCVSVAADQIGHEHLGGPVSGSGGAVGAALNFWLQATFHPVGACLIYGAAAFLGLMLAAEHVVVLAARGSFGCIRSVFRMFAWAVSFKPQGSTLAGDPEAPRNRRKASPTLQPVVAELDHAEADHGSLARIPISRSKHESARAVTFELPSLDMLDDPQPFPFEKHDEQLREVGAQLEKTFKDFGLTVRVIGIHTGPVITQYEIALETGLRVAKVTALADDLALGLKVPSVRIVAPLPGRNTVGVEVPNEHRAVVRLKELFTAGTSKIARAKLPLFLGKDTEGRPLVYDLADMPHLLIAGTTGTGKSVCMNSIILSILMTRRPDEIKMIMVDPKRTELTDYSKLPHLMHPVVNDMKKAEAILAWAVDKMEERYDILSRARVRSLAVYNELGKDEILRRIQPDPEEAAHIPERMPYVVIVVDEMNDLMMQMKREVEGHIIRLAQKSRAAGIHLCVATQKPTVDVITGLIKSNLPARICFQVSSRTDSRVVLDEMGADKLLGKGDMLFLQPGTSQIIRAQGTYASDQEITAVTENLECDPVFAQELMQLKTNSDAGGMQKRLREDDMYEPAVEIVIREG